MYKYLDALSSRFSLLFCIISNMSSPSTDRSVSPPSSVQTTTTTKGKNATDERFPAGFQELTEAQSTKLFKCGECGGSTTSYTQTRPAGGAVTTVSHPHAWREVARRLIKLALLLWMLRPSVEIGSAVVVDTGGLFSPLNGFYSFDVLQIDLSRDKTFL